MCSSDLLESEGVISNAFLLNLVLTLEGNRSKVRAGEFLFKKEASLRDVMETLVNGREILHSVTIPEGLTSEQIVTRLRASEVLSGDIREIPKEGTLLADTYRVARGMSRNDLLNKMQADQRRLLEQIWQRRANNLPLRSPFELVTLASIVEKETGKADERPRVAAVFVNRLSQRMRLQSDPTIVYGLVGGKGTLGRGIMRSEIEKPTPYNTYVIEGLPPGPIANPGRAAMEAVARPSQTRELFFVADGTGGHVFAETLDQHNRNVQRWLPRYLAFQAREHGYKTELVMAQPIESTGGFTDAIAQSLAASRDVADVRDAYKPLRRRQGCSVIPEYKQQVYVCLGPRCTAAGAWHNYDVLRQSLRARGLDQPGPQRVMVVRTA